MSNDKIKRAGADTNAIMNKSPIKSVDGVGITFVNAVIGRGYWNGVVNIQLGAFQFTATQDATQVNNDLVVCSRLRMDLVAAVELRDALTAVIDGIEVERQRAEAAISERARAASAPATEAAADATKLN